ncbi:PucR family transcriptional regulator [Nocardia altamirensis]|uniref:PucR family transcriptional regulator n=1 Tax=Nocardia altamirensis TaxID=472158 RepID=UPI001435449E|nr:helix-turn-helix domain-containing protein [Nocardia altamirensis]
MIQPAARGPGARDLLMTLVAGGAAFAERFVERMRVEIPTYANLPADALVPTTLAALTVVFDTIRDGRDFDAADLAALAEHGEVRGRQGVSLDEVFAGWHLASRMLLDDLIAIGRKDGVSDGVLLDLSHDLLRIADTAMLASARGHHVAEFEIARVQQNHRADLVRGILFGTSSPASIRMQMEGYGLAYDRDYHAFRSRPTEAVDLRDLERALDLTPIHGRPRGLAALVDGDLVGFVDHAPPTDLPVPVGLGPAVRPDRLESSFRLATRAMTTAIAFGSKGTHDLPGLGLLPAVVADIEIGAEMVARYLAPLGAGDAVDALLGTVEVYLATDMRVDRTAEQLHLHPNTVRYRITRFERLTETSLRDARSILEVWWALQYRKVLER